MCGVLGIYNKLPLKISRTLLQTLVHRGQDASGLVWVDQYKVHNTSKNKGPPYGIKVPDESPKVTIGSTRYPTFGNREGEVELHKFAQPFSYQTKLGTLSLSHNGNISNLKMLSDEEFQSDAEFITLRLGELIDEFGNLENALEKLTHIIDGAYSLVGILGEDMFAFRDPRAIRPLVYGTNGIQHYFCSESLVLQQARVDTFSDVKAGELILIKDNNVTRKLIVEPENISHCYFEYVYFASSASVIDGQNVYLARLNLGTNLGKSILKKNLKLDYVAPIPDTSKAASKTVSEILNVPLREAILKNRSSLRTFIMPGVDYRENEVKSKYLFVDEFIKDKRILIIDDSIVRGLTMKYLVKILKEKGASEIHVGITCPPQKYACFYGVDFGSDEELIASNETTIEEIRDIIGATSLTYLGLEGLRDSLNQEGICDACLTGNYPTPHGKLIRLQIIDGNKSKGPSYYE